MTRLLAVLCLSLQTVGAFAQGLVNFFNNASTLVSVGPTGQQVPISAPPGSYYFGLLTASPGTTDTSLFTFSGLYATNQAVAGRIYGGAGLAVPGWFPGQVKSFFVAGWSASLGPAWNNAWLGGSFGESGDFGVSSIAMGIAGAPGSDTLPQLNLFSVNGIPTSGTGIPTGFDLYPVPEPTAAFLAALWAIVLVAYQPRKRGRLRSVCNPERRTRR